MSKIHDYTEAVMRLIAKDVREGAVPAAVASFTDLHDHVDANMYLVDVGQIYDGSDASMAEVNAIEDAVSARLKAGALLADTRAGVIDMGAVTAELNKLGVPAECGNSGGNVQTIYAGTLAVDKYGEPRHAVLAGPGYLDTVNGRVVQVGYTGEWVFGPDDDGVGKVYSASHDEPETPAQLAARIAELVKLVDAKRDEREALLEKIGGGLDDDGEGVSEALGGFWDHVTQKLFPGVHQGDNDTLTEGALQAAAHNAVRAWLLRNFDMTVTLPEATPAAERWLAPVKPDSGELWTLMHVETGWSMPTVDLFTDPDTAIGVLAGRVRHTWALHHLDGLAPDNDHEAVARFFDGGKRGRWELTKSTVNTMPTTGRRTEYALVNPWGEVTCICGNDSGFAGFGYTAADGSDNGAEEGPLTHVWCNRCGRVVDVATGRVTATA